MSTATLTPPRNLAQEMEYATFYVGDILLGVDIGQMEEINRQLEVTVVPHAPPFVRGVVNLRGEVVTVVDPRVILGLPVTEVSATSRTVIVRHKGEQIGLLVDRIADVVRISVGEMEPPPANVGGVEGRFFKGVYKLQTELLIVLDVETALSAPTSDRQA
ncbi:MAG TPA: chemotaxis protein CheW [Phycisphaerae bacterium]|nr:chemotaxis protein CheW [Phycisphaerae bacterium]HRY68071.1 chemotaxis protein CheW [Phycisphaerae bacterium]HSA29039.1 chemotaxis protein CheW [Phycisphaerae bacterium]